MKKPKATRKMTHVIKWTVNPYRKDKRTGAISPVQLSKYGKYAMDEIDNQFKKED